MMFPFFFVDDVNGIGRGVDDDEVVVVKGDGMKMGAKKGGVADFCGSRRGDIGRGAGCLFESRYEPDSDDGNGGE